MENKDGLCLEKTATLEATNISHLGKNENPLRKVPKSRGYLNCLEGSWWFQAIAHQFGSSPQAKSKNGKYLNPPPKQGLQIRRESCFLRLSLMGVGSTQQVEWIHDMAGFHKALLIDSGMHSRKTMIVP